MITKQFQRFRSNNIRENTDIKVLPREEARQFILYLKINTKILCNALPSAVLCNKHRETYPTGNIWTRTTSKIKQLANTSKLQPRIIWVQFSPSMDPNLRSSPELRTQQHHWQDRNWYGQITLPLDPRLKLMPALCHVCISVHMRNMDSNNWAT